MRSAMSVAHAPPATVDRVGSADGYSAAAAAMNAAAAAVSASAQVVSTVAATSSAHALVAAEGCLAPHATQPQQPQQQLSQQPPHGLHRQLAAAEPDTAHLGRGGELPDTAHLGREGELHGLVHHCAMRSHSDSTCRCTCYMDPRTPAVPHFQPLERKKR